MYDDDGELYYSGRLAVRGGADSRDFSDQPLADFGMPNAACTYILFPGRTVGQATVTDPARPHPLEGPTTA